MIRQEIFYIGSGPNAQLFVDAVAVDVFGQRATVVINQNVVIPLAVGCEIRGFIVVILLGT